FVNGIAWQDGYELNLYGPVQELMVTLIRSQTLSAGSGKVQGRMLADHPDEPYILLLKDQASKKVMKWAVSGPDQSFSFDELPFGRYLLTAEKPSQSVSRSFDLTENQPIVSDIELNPSLVLGQSDAFSNELGIHPTIIEDYVYLKNEAYAGHDFSVKLRSITGQLVMTEDLRLEAGQTAKLALPVLERGIYFIKMVNVEGHLKVAKLIKR
ncbi:MAG: hypothetical protein AAFY41_17750, partial [Bacteroidota bacterium]